MFLSNVFDLVLTKMNQISSVFKAKSFVKKSQIKPLPTSKNNRYVRSFENVLAKRSVNTELKPMKEFNTTTIVNYVTQMTFSRFCTIVKV